MEENVLFEGVSCRLKPFSFFKRFIPPTLVLTLFVGLFLYAGARSTDDIAEESVNFVYLKSPSISAVTTKRGVISVPSSVVKAHPFEPYRDIEGLSSSSDVPEYELVPPPSVIGEDSSAARVMDTIVSGILYDKFSPSAILNIEGNDYLVKKGDVVNGYSILSIVKDSVTVKLGSNVYKAGIGEILTEGEINYNEVSNLNNKFGGVR